MYVIYFFLNIVKYRTCTMYMYMENIDHIVNEVSNFKILYYTCILTLFMVIT